MARFVPISYSVDYVKKKGTQKRTILFYSM
jgi:hypothetical protein